MYFQDFISKNTWRDATISPQSLWGETGWTEKGKTIFTDCTPQEEVYYSSFLENTLPRKKKKIYIYIT